MNQLSKSLLCIVKLKKNFDNRIMLQRTMKIFNWDFMKHNTYEFMLEKWKNIIKYLKFNNLIVWGYEYEKSKVMRLT